MMTPGSVSATINAEGRPQTGSTTITPSATTTAPKNSSVSAGTGPNGGRPGGPAPTGTAPSNSTAPAGGPAPSNGTAPAGGPAPSNGTAPAGGAGNSTTGVRPPPPSGPTPPSGD
jgi:hypothetical protein